MGNVGYISLLIALITSIYAAAAFIIAARGKSRKIFHSARNGLIAVAGLVSVSVLILIIAIFSHNFKLEYIASYTSLNTAPAYLLSALWAGNSGSLLLWAWLLSLFSLIVVLQKQAKNRELMPYAAMVMMLCEAFILILIVALASPFKELAAAPADGLGLNPMLENAGMIFHPPLLLAGYVAFAIPFAFAISSLLIGKIDDEWLKTTRRWALMSWLFLGVGNIIGAWWAYVELGWGGYWAWDPVENAGLMPWLMATAFLHSSIIQRRKGIFKVWNTLLIILTFCLVIFGTFLTRSGILSSVHTFNDIGMTPFFMGFLALALFGSLGLLYYRYEDLRGSGTESIVSREGTFLLNNILLVGVTIVVLVGTIFPSISEAVRGVKVSLNASFFNQVNGPLFLAIILLAGICTIIGWKKASLKRLFGRLLWPLIASLVIAIVLFITVIKEPVVLIAFLICSFVLLSILSDWIRGVRMHHKAEGNNYIKSWWNLLWSNTQRYGGYIVHAGIILIAIGVIGSSFYSVEKESSLRVGDSINIKQYIVTYDGLKASETPDKSIVSASLSIYNSGHLIDKLVSEKYFHKSQEQPVTEVAIRSGLTEDLYVILESWRDSGAVADFKVLVNPLVSWIWIGGGVFLLGGLITFWPGRRSNTSLNSESDVEGKTPVPVLPGKDNSRTNRTLKAEDEIENQILTMRKQKGKYCPRCGSKGQEGNRFCTKCGANLTGDGKNG